MRSYEELRVGLLYLLNPYNYSKRAQVFNPFGRDLTAAKTLARNDNGGVSFLNSATEFAVTLPAVTDIESGWHHRIVIKAAPVGANYTVVTDSGSNIIQGLAVVNGATVAAADEDTITFTASAAVAGDWVDLYFDGTNFMVSGQAQAATGIAFTAT